MNDKVGEEKYRSLTVQELQRLFDDPIPDQLDGFNEIDNSASEALQDTPGAEVPVPTARQSVTRWSSEENGRKVREDFSEDMVKLVAVPSISLGLPDDRRESLIDWAIVNYGLFILAVLFVFGAGAYGFGRVLVAFSSDEIPVSVDSVIRTDVLIATGQGCVIPSILPSPIDDRVVRPAQDTVQVYAGIGIECNSLGSVNRASRLIPLSGAVEGNGEPWLFVELSNPDDIQGVPTEGWIPVADLVPIG